MSTGHDCAHCRDEEADFSPDHDPWERGDWLCHGCKVYRELFDQETDFERALAQRAGRGW